MTRPDGWPVVSELASPETRWGLRFLDEEVEQDYRSWRAGHVRAFTQVAMYGAAGAAFCALVAVVFGALGHGHYRTLGLVLIPLMVLLLLAGVVVSRDEDAARLSQVWSSAANLVGGVLAVS